MQACILKVAEKTFISDVGFTSPRNFSFWSCNKRSIKSHHFLLMLRVLMLRWSAKNSSLGIGNLTWWVVIYGVPYSVWRCRNLFCVPVYIAEMVGFIFLQDPRSCPQGSRAYSAGCARGPFQASCYFSVQRCSRSLSELAWRCRRFPMAVHRFLPELLEI